MGQSDILKRASVFMPQFISTTDKLLNDPEYLKNHQMDIKVKCTDKQEGGNVEEYEEDKQEDTQQQMINMDIGVGIYDILNPDFKEKNFKPSSTEQVIKVQGMNAEENDSDESSSDEDSNHLYYEFNSSSDNDNIDAQSMNTMSTDRKAPLIQDITPQQQKSKKDNKNKRKNRE